MQHVLLVPILYLNQHHTEQRQQFNMDHQPNTIKTLEFCEGSLHDLMRFVYREINSSEHMLNSLDLCIRRSFHQGNAEVAYEDVISTLKFLRAKLCSLQKYHRASLDIVDLRLQELKVTIEKDLQKDLQNGKEKEKVLTIVNKTEPPQP